MPPISQEEFLQSETATILERCTACGKCVEVCPNWSFLSIEDDATAAVAGGIVGLLRNGLASDAAGRFVDACSGTALCRDVCPEGIDPYTMMRLANVKHAVAKGKRPPASDYHLIDLSLRTQIGPNEPRWFTRRPPAGARAEYVFYMGCNIMRTPHIALGVMAILDELGLDYATVGGGANCCGIKQFRVGLPAAETVSRNTMNNFATLRPKEVISWCPTCEIHFGDFGANYVERDFPINHLSRLLVRNLDRLRPRLRPLPMRVILEEHAQLHADDTVREDIPAVLGAIPGLEIIPTAQHVYGYQCAAIGLPEAQQAALEETMAEAHRVGADAIVSVFHGCHRHLVKAVARRREPFEVVNWVSLLCRSLGIEQVDRYRGYVTLGEEDAILEQALELDAGQGIPIQKLREAIHWEFGS